VLRHNPFRTRTLDDYTDDAVFDYGVD